MKPASPRSYKLRIALLALLAIPGIALAQSQPNPVAAPPRLKSPEVSTGNKITFRLNAPAASTVTLNGSWLGATGLPMTIDAAGVWSTTVGPLDPQLYGYWFVV